MSKKLIILDIEGSGLSSKSYPIEFGWALVDAPKGASFLIRPTKSWLKNGEWSSNAELIHGIPKERLLDEGIPVAEAAQRVNEALDGHRVLVDGGQYDPHWYRRLFDAAGVRPSEELFSYDNALRKRVGETGAAALVVETGPETQFKLRLERVNAAVRACYTYDHRAGNDAEFLAARFRAMIDEEFLLRTESLVREKSKRQDEQCNTSRPTS